MMHIMTIYINQEHHMRKLAEFEDKENFSSPDKAWTAVHEVKDYINRVCEGHEVENSTCPCLIFRDVEKALLNASQGHPDPWINTRKGIALRRAAESLRLARELDERNHDDFVAGLVGRCYGKAYQYYLG